MSNCACCNEETSLVTDILSARAFEMREEPFILASGKKSHVYINMKKILFNRYGLSSVCLPILDTITDIIDECSRKGERLLIAGMELGAVPLVVEVSAMADCDMLVIRKQTKKYGTCNLIEGSSNPGDKVIILEDVTTTGDSVVKSINACKDIGLEVVGVVSVVDRQEGGAEVIEQICPFSSILTKQSFFDELKRSNPDEM